MNIPPLAFRDGAAQVDRSVNEMQDRFSSLKGWNTEYGRLISAKDWVCRSASVQVNSTKLVVVAHAPTMTKAISNHSATIFFPMSGGANNSKVNGTNFSWNTGQHALYAPEGERVASAGTRSVLMIDVDKNRFLTTLNIMSGLCQNSSNFDFGSPLQIPLFVNNVSFISIVHGFCGLIDSFQQSQDLLDRSGVDDLIYRTLVMMCRPDLFFSEIRNSENHEYYSRGLDQACQYIMAHLDQPLTLTDLENVASLSRRGLQYAFLKRFDCTPMRWMREQRLMLARRKLMQMGHTGAVMEIAISCGFNSASMFAKYYKQRFGESPSETWARRR